MAITLTGTERIAARLAIEDEVAIPSLAQTSPA